MMISNYNAARSQVNNQIDNSMGRMKRVDSPFR